MVNSSTKAADDSVTGEFSGSRGLVGLSLLALAITFTAEITAFSFLSEIARNKQLTRELAQQAILFGLGVSVVGSALATVLKLRWGYIVPAAIGFVVEMIAMLLFFVSDTALGFWLATLLLYWGFGFAMPYRAGLVAASDPAGKFATFLITAQTLALAVGPAISGYLVVSRSYSSAYLFWIGLFCMGLWLYIYTVKKYNSQI